ncbi:MAG TPA: hypothetical protein VMT85_19145 [Thermoanaerobaculia bacterium]|nr:hypothetical protein [Thermoanaerobaculia bacterium]
MSFDPTMPFQSILAKVLAQNRDALGVLFLDESGETVDVACGSISADDMQLLGAYVGIYLRQVERFLSPDQHGAVRWLQIEDRDLNVYTIPLPDGYHLVLAQKSPSLTAVARRTMEEAREQLVRELFH